MGCRYITLAPGETVISSTSNLYPLTCLDKIKLVLTCGLYWCYALRHKRNARQGFVLTTHRLITIQVERGDSFLSMILPASLLCCCPTQRSLIVRSMYPKEVASGMIEREKRKMIGRVLTDKGAIQLNFAVFGDELVAPGERESVRRPRARGGGRGVWNLQTARAHVPAGASLVGYSSRALPLSSALRGWCAAARSRPRRASPSSRR